MLHKNKWLKQAMLASALLLANPFNLASAAVVTSIRPLGFIAAAIADGVLQPRFYYLMAHLPTIMRFVHRMSSGYVAPNWLFGSGRKWKHFYQNH